MRYIEPKIEIIMFNEEDIIRTSLTNGGAFDVDGNIKVVDD